MDFLNFTLFCGLTLCLVYLNIGTYIDKKCPFTGNVSIRGRILAGTCHSAKMNRTIIVRRNYLHYVKKYQRQELVTYTMLAASLLLLLVLTPKLFQIWEEALQYSSSHITMLPCERGRSCYYWTVQVRTILFWFFCSFFSLFVVTVGDNILCFTGLYPKPWGSMS